MMIGTALEKAVLEEIILGRDDIIERTRKLMNRVNILGDLNQITAGWGMECLRFEISSYAFPEWLLKTYSDISARKAKEEAAREEAELQKWAVEANQRAVCEEEKEEIAKKYREAEKAVIQKLEANMKWAMGLKENIDEDNAIKEKKASADEERRAKEAGWEKEAEWAFKDFRTSAEAILELDYLESEQEKDEKQIEMMVDRVQKETEAILRYVEFQFHRMDEIRKWKHYKIKEIEEFEQELLGR